jgi:hypothetical protein
MMEVELAQGLSDSGELKGCPYKKRNYRFSIAKYDWIVKKKRFSKKG